MADHDDEEILQDWCDRLCTALELEGVPIDVKAVLGLAGRAAHAVVRPAAPLTTFVAGYAAGLSAGRGQAGPDEAMARTMQNALALCRAEQRRREE